MQIIQTGIAYKDNSVWTKNSNTFVRTKKLESESIAKVNTYAIGIELGRGFEGFAALLEPINAPEEQRVKVCKQATSDLEHEFNIPKLWKNKSEGLSIHPKAYFPAHNGSPNTIILHQYDKTIEFLINNNMSCQDRIKAICQVSKGVTTLHSLGIAHNDIYKCNVMHDAYLDRYDLIDFGRAKVNGNTEFDNSMLQYFVYMILGGREGKYRTFNPPTLAEIQKAGFDLSAEKLYAICQELKNTNASDIHAIFTAFKEQASEIY